MNEQLNLAKIQLKQKNLTCIVSDINSIIFESYDRGIKPLFDFIKNHKKDNGPYFLADKVIGKAAALLCVKAGITEVYAFVLSDAAAEIFRNYSISFSYGRKVGHILNRTETGHCPMEKLSNGVEDPEEMFIKIEQWIKSMQLS